MILSEVFVGDFGKWDVRKRCDEAELDTIRDNANCPLAQELGNSLERWQNGEDAGSCLEFGFKGEVSELLKASIDRRLAPA
jgi:hypothetical protein